MIVGALNVGLMETDNYENNTHYVEYLGTCACCRLSVVKQNNLVASVCSLCSRTSLSRCGSNQAMLIMYRTNRDLRLFKFIILDAVYLSCM